MTARREYGRLVEEAVRRELDALNADTLSPALYALALSDAQLIDACASPRDAASLSKELREVRTELHALAAASTAGEETDIVDALEDELKARREEREAAAAARFDDAADS